MGLLITLAAFHGSPQVASQPTSPEGIDFKSFLEGVKLSYNHELSINESYGDGFEDFIFSEYTVSSIFRIDSINDTYIEMNQTMAVSMNSYANMNDTVYYPNYYITFPINDTNTGTLSSKFVANTTSMDITIIDANGTEIRPIAFYNNDVFSETEWPGIIPLASNNFYQIQTNISNWAVGEAVIGFTVNRSEIYQGLDAWVLGVDLGWATFEYYYEKNTGILLGLFGESETSRSIRITSYTLDLSVFENDIPVINASDGFKVNSISPVNIDFQVTDDNIIMYNLYQNGTIFTSGSNLTDWSFTVTPELGNTTWTLEVIDKFNIKASATTWVKYEIPLDDTSKLDTDTASKDSTSSTVPSSFNPVFVFGIYASLIYYIVKKSSKK